MHFLGNARGEAMRWNLFNFCPALFAAAASHAIAAENNSAHFNRAQSVINTFQVMCTLELPDFDHIDAKATAMKMRLKFSNSAPSAGDTAIRSKIWAGNLTDGPFVLMLDEMTGAQARTTSCAVVADVPDRDAFRREAISTMKLPREPPPEFGGDGSRSYYWEGVFGSGTTVIDRDFGRNRKPGVMLKLLSASH